jgi:ATP-binding cassette subfamily F protein uup
MTILLGCQKIAKSYHARHRFHDLSLGVYEGDRIGIIGPNGAGKSTLLRILAGLEEPDAGTVARKRQVRTAYVTQTEGFNPELTVLALTIAGARAGGVPAEDAESKAKIVLGQVGFADVGVKAGTLSGGWKKRLSLASALVQAPDVLLLDEPTNHLDLEGILWLEKVLTGFRGTVVMVSHDRAFLERTVTKVAEIHAMYPEGVFVSEGKYSDFLVKRADWQNLQARLEETMANKARRETEWLRRGPQARATKAKYRIDEANALIGDLAELRGRLRGGETRIDFSATGRKTKRLVVLEGVNKTLGDRRILKDFDFVVAAGMNIGILGANGTGKTTLLKLFMRQLAPDSGTVTLADDLKVVYFDQNRNLLDFGKTLKASLAPSGDSVIFQDKSIHVLSWARRFQFRPEQMDLLVSELSGGEQARLLIAQLMLTPADVLLLDEPTNDLDIPTLEVLEESLAEFPGSVVLVTHDRYFMDQVCNLTIGLDGEGGTHLYADFEQWEKAQQQKAKDRAKAAKDVAQPGGATADAGDAKRGGSSSKKLSYKEQREFDGMEQALGEAEADVAKWQSTVDDPQLASSAVKLAEACANLEKAQARVEQLYARWAELEGKMQ